MSQSPLTYARLKLFASLLRFFASFNTTTPIPYPDETYTLPSRMGKRQMKIHVYKPPDRLKSGPSPVLINFHGSGFVIPMHGSDSDFCRKVAEETDYTVLDASYALGPEYPFPAALEDVEDVVCHVLGKPDVYDGKTIALSGFSAGGNLALVAASNGCGRIPKDSIHTVMAFYPACDLATPPSQKKAPDGSRGTIPPMVANFFNECYIPPSTNSSDARISVVNANPENFPRNVLIVTCGKDNLATEAETLGQKLKKRDGCRVTLKQYEDQGHGFDKKANDKGVWERILVDTGKMYRLGVAFLLTGVED